MLKTTIETITQFQPNPKDIAICPLSVRKYIKALEKALILETQNV